MLRRLPLSFFNDTATTEIYTLALHDALPISLHLESLAVARRARARPAERPGDVRAREGAEGDAAALRAGRRRAHLRPADRKSTRLNSSHANISYAVFCLKKNILYCPLL